MMHKKLRLIIPLVMLAVCCSLSAKTYLVSVGIGDYSQFPLGANNLNLTVNDAKTIAWLYSKNTSVDYALLIDEKATRDRIVRAIKKVFRNAKANDIVVFFFSGHGYPGGLCAYDSKIGYNEIRKAMAVSKCKNKMMFVDACHSGAMRVEDTDAQSAYNSAKRSNVMLFLSSRNTETSIENRRMENGFFTTYLQKGLRGNADSNRDRTITAKELFTFVSQGVSTLSRDRQHPVMWGNFSDNMPVMRW